MLHDQLELKQRIDGLKQELKLEPTTLAPPALVPSARASPPPARAAKLPLAETTAAKKPPVAKVATLGTAISRSCWQGEGCGDGTCNEDLGRCDCPPFKKGPKCAKPLFPACVDQWGLKPPVATCGIHSQPAFPASCACVAQCHEMGLDARQECVVQPKPGQSMAAAASEAKQAMPWMPMVANISWLQRTVRDARQSQVDGLCSGRGTYSVQLPYDFYPKDKDCVPTDRRHKLEECANQRTPRCRCFPGFSGPQCETAMDDSRGLHKCLNECSGRGACQHNFCKCQPGSWGDDCSLGRGSEVAVPAAAVRPLIYVYDMPPRFTSWLAAFRKGDWSRDHWYGVDVILHKMLLRSRHRTLDPAQADFFFIPLHLSLGYYSHRYYFKHFTQPAHKPLRDAIAYVKATWPQHWARRGGRDHIMVMTQDQGNRFVRAQVPESAPLMMIHHWGAPPDRALVDGAPQGDHRKGQDLCVPPFHGEQAKLNRWIPKQLNAEQGGCVLNGLPTFTCEAPSIDVAALRVTPRDASFTRELFFSGKMNLNWGRHYSLGVRQAAYRAHKAHPRVLIMTFDNGVQEKVPLTQHVQNYATSKFCLAPAGYGFSSRQYECVLVGCVPVVIQDDVEMAFEEVLPWRRFSLRLNFSDIPILPQLLARVPAAHVARLRRGIGCVWPRMLWLAPGLYEAKVDADKTLQSSRPYDAFETTMWALRDRLGLPSNANASWRARGRSCVEEPGDEAELDLDALRAQVRAEGVSLSKDATDVATIISDWQRTGDDKEFAMKTRFFPGGVKIPGVKWT